jgi:zinc D-Ala-D-Ala carboxypeptidase
VTMKFDAVADIPVGFWNWPHFSPTELCDKRDGSLVAVDSFLDMLETLRSKCGFPLIIASGYRSPEHNVEVSSTHSLDGPHTLGVAVDLALVPSDWRTYIVLQAAFALGFVGIEVTPTHVHLDMAPSRPDAPRPLFWIATA